jgi:hypothetical protein
MAKILKLTDPRTGEIYRVAWDGDQMPDAATKKQLLIEQRAKKGAKATEESPSMFSSVAGRIDKTLNLPKQPLLDIGSKVAGTPLDNFGDVYKNIFAVGPDYQQGEGGLPPGILSTLARATSPVMAGLDLFASHAPKEVSAPVVGAVGEIQSDPLLPLTGAPGRAVAGAGAVSAGLHSAEAFHKDKPVEGGLYALLAAMGAHGARGAKVPEDVNLGDIAAGLEDNVHIPNGPNNPNLPVPPGARGTMPAAKGDIFQPDVYTAPKTEAPVRPELPALPPGKPSFKGPELPITSPGQPVNNLDPFASLFPQPQAHAPFPEAPLDLQNAPFAPEEASLFTPPPTEFPMEFTPPVQNPMESPVRGGTASRSGVFFERNPTSPRPDINNPFDLSDARDVAGLDINVAPESAPRLSPLDQKVNTANKARRPIEAGTFSGTHDAKTGTFGLKDAQGGKIGGKILDDRVELHSIGKGTGKNSQAAIDAAIALGEAEGKPVYLSASEQSLSGGKMVENLMKRGQLEQTADGYLLRRTGGPKVEKAYSGIPIDALVDDIKEKFPKLAGAAADIADFVSQHGKDIHLKASI